MRTYTKLNKKDLLFDKNGYCYKEQITISKETFEHLKLKIERN